MLDNKNPKKVEVDDYTQRITFDIIGLMVYGKNWDTLRDNAAGRRFSTQYATNFRLIQYLQEHPLHPLRYIKIIQLVRAVHWTRYVEATIEFR